MHSPLHNSPRVSRCILSYVPAVNLYPKSSETCGIGVFEKERHDREFEHPELRMSPLHTIRSRAAQWDVGSRRRKDVITRVTKGRRVLSPTR